MTFGESLREFHPEFLLKITLRTLSLYQAKHVLTFRAIPSIIPSSIASPLRLGAVKLSPYYALPLNAETLTSHTGDCQLSVGCC